jgi:Leucine-rich repeat (LRR) protein
MSPSLLSLENLEYLNLSNALTSPNGGVPEFLGSFKNLTHLDLSSTYFTGIVPPQLGNLSKLEYLDLSYSWSSWSGIYLTDISWLTRLPLLVHLDMSFTNLSSVVGWPLVVNMIPSLKYLSLGYYSLSSANQFLEHLNLTTLRHLISPTTTLLIQFHPLGFGT